MNPKAAYKPIMYIVESVSSDLKETTTKNYPYYLKWAIDSYRQLNLFTLPVIKTVMLPLESNLTVDLPSDFVSYISVGIRIGKHLYLLGLDNDLVLGLEKECEVPIEQVVQKPDHFSSLFPYWYFFGGAIRGGQYVGEQYALGGGWSRKGYYKIDLERHQIQFSSVIPKTEIVLEYKSTGIDCDGSVEVPYQAIDAMIAFVHWKRVENDSLLAMNNPKAHAMQTQERYAMWKTAFKQLHHFNMMQDFTLQNYIDTKNRQSKMTPKRS